ncbi:MAG: hypothetical protein EOO85_04380, partial [Pedobacter sp.]
MTAVCVLSCTLISDRHCSCFYITKYFEIKMLKKVPLLLVTLAFLLSCATKQASVNKKSTIPGSSLETSFIKPPDTIQTSIYWYWMSDNISK